MLYSHKGNYPSELPDRIRLSNGQTRTDKNSFTNEEIADAGYVLAPIIDLAYDKSQKKLAWDGHNWTTENLTEDERQHAISEKRNVINNFIIAEINRIETILYVPHVLPEISDDLNDSNADNIVRGFNENISGEDRDKMLKYIEEWKKYLNMENPFDPIDEPVLDISL